MPDLLSAADWKTEYQSYADAKDAKNLSQPLTEFGKAKTNAEKQTAIKAVITEAESLKTKNKKVAKLVAYLEKLIARAKKESDEIAKAIEKEGKEEKAKEKESEGQAKDKKTDKKAVPDPVLRKAFPRALTVERNAPWFFVVALGGRCGVAISKREPRKTQKDAARAFREGNGKLLAGRLYGEGGKYILELDQKPPGGLGKALRTGLKFQTKRDFKPIILRAGGVDLDAELDNAPLTDLGTDVPDPADDLDTGPVDDFAEDEGPEDEGDDADDEGDDAGDDQTSGAEKADSVTATGVDGAKVAALQEAWRLASELAMDGVLKLVGSLRSFADEDANTVADILDGLVEGFPTGLDEALEEMEGAALSGDASAADKAKARTRASIKVCLDYLKTNAKTISACETNPFGLNLEVAAPLKVSLKEILQGVG